MLAELGDPATRVLDAAADTAAAVAAAGERRLDRIDAATAVVVVPSDEAQNAVPELMTKVCALVDQAAAYERVVLDLRGTRGTAPLWSVKEAVLRCLPRLLDRDVALAPERFLNHGFYPFQSVNGGAGGLGSLHGSLLAVSASGVLRGEARRTSRLAAIIDAGSIDLYPALMGLQNAGLAYVVQDGDVRDAGLWVEPFAADGDLNVAIRQGECLRGNGAGGFQADEVVPKTAKGGVDPARAAALRAVSSTRGQSRAASPIASVPFLHEAFVEKDYSETPYPSRELRMLALFRFWNVIEYFFPYKDRMDQAWDATLLEFIPRLRDARDAVDYALVVAELSTRVQDSHVTLSSAVLDAHFGTHRPAMRVDLVEGETVITELAPELAAAGVVVGDVVVSVDGEDVGARRARLARYLPASTPGRLENKIDIQLLLGPADRPARIEARGDDGVVRRLEAPRSLVGLAPRAQPRTGPTYRVLPEGYGYVDLERLRATETQSAFAAIRQTPGLILDMRGYPSGGVVPRFVLHLADGEPRPAELGGTPRYDGRYFFLEEGLGAPMTPARERYAGPVVVLVNGSTQSAAEYVCMVIKSLRHALFLGSTTSGANGGVSRTVLPGGIVVNFTGMSIRHPDGRPLQRVGILPDIVRQPTRRGVREGRDELLEAAVAQLKQGRT